MDVKEIDENVERLLRENKELKDQIHINNDRIVEYEAMKKNLEKKFLFRSLLRVVDKHSKKVYLVMLTQVEFGVILIGIDNRNRLIDEKF